MSKKVIKSKEFSLNEKEAEALLCCLQIADLRLLDNKENIRLCEELRDCFNWWLESGIQQR